MIGNTVGLNPPVSIAFRDTDTADAVCNADQLQQGAEVVFLCACSAANGQYSNHQLAVERYSQRIHHGEGKEEITFTR